MKTLFFYIKKWGVVTSFFLFFVNILVIELYSSDKIKVYFNEPGTLTPAKSGINEQDKAIDEALIHFIDSAVSGDILYACIYDMDHDGIRDAFNRATSRGTILYFISDNAAGNTAEYNSLTTPNKILDDSTNLMHNKFCVLKDSAVWTGSYNITDNGTSNNDNNAVLIYSKELAQVFENEFLYMYNGSAGKFSTHKVTSPYTAKSVDVDGTDIDVYFSPYNASSKTNTSMVIEKLIESAAESVFFSMFTFTDDRIKEALIGAHMRGLEVKGVLEAGNSAEMQSEFRANGMNVVLDANDDLLHHKYCIIDYGTSHAKVITGSYNWTIAARDSNDENFIVIHSKDVADTYWKEFMRSYSLAGGVVSAQEQKAVSRVVVYPSPAKDVSNVTIGFNTGMTISEIEISVYTLSGEKVIKIIPEFYPGTYNEVVWVLENSDGEKISSGLYVVKVKAETGDGAFFSTEKFAVIR